MRQVCQDWEGSLELDVSDNDVAAAADRVADWLEITGGLYASTEPGR